MATAKRSKRKYCIDFPIISAEQASGGFLRYFTIGPKEDRLIKLPTVDPIPEPEESEGFSMF